MKNNFFIFLVVVFSLSSCSTKTPDSRARQSAGQIGCLPKDIIIADDDGWENWTAICKKKRFICTEVVSTTQMISCKEELK